MPEQTKPRFHQVKFKWWVHLVEISLVYMVVLPIGLVMVRTDRYNFWSYGFICLMWTILIMVIVDHWFINHNRGIREIKECEHVHR
jgi:hypothetical protein